MYKTDRTYQKDLCQFMVRFKEYQFFSDHGNKLNKPALFDSIYRNHIDMNGAKEFDIESDTTCMLLANNNHPVIRTRPREFVNFNEADAISEALETVTKKHAIVIVREQVTCPTLTPIEAIELVQFAIKRMYEQHEDMEKEIELLIK